MRKLKLQVQISVDGYIAGPNAEMDWMSWNWGDDIKDYVTGITMHVDTIIMGRKLAEGFIPYWAAVAANAEDPQQAFGKIMSDTHKVVFSKTLQKSEWENTDLATGDLTAEVNKLKNMDGEDIIAYGGANFVSNLIKEGLIDELHLFVNPAAVGSGMPIFKEINSILKLKLEKSIAFDCGIVLLKYSPAK